jgi:hypothetical protein
MHSLYKTNQKQLSEAETTTFYIKIKSACE